MEKKNILICVVFHRSFFLYLDHLSIDENFSNYEDNLGTNTIEIINQQQTSLIKSSNFENCNFTIILHARFPDIRMTTKAIFILQN